MCELLPASMPSLAVDLLLLQYGDTQLRLVDQEASSILGCSTSFLFQPPIDSYYVNCNFPGWEVLSTIQGFSQVREQFAKVLNDSVVRGWLTDYNIHQQFSSPTHLSGISTELSYLQNSLESLKRESATAFDVVYDAHTAKEWFDTHVQPMLDHVNKLQTAIDSLRSKNVWPRRPLS